MKRKMTKMEGYFPLLILRKRGPGNMISVIRESTDINSFLHLLDVMFTPRLIKRITTRTKTQSENSYWFLYRRGVITGTLAKRVIAQNFKAENNDKLNRVITKCFPSSFVNEAMLYGTKNEKNALMAFYDIFKKSHKNVRINNIGLVLHDKFPYIGGSPDAIASCDCCLESFLIEVKCPFRLCETGIPSWRILEYFDEQQNLKKTHTYFNQINLYQGIMNIKTAYFVVYACGEVIVRQINFDKDFFNFQIKHLSEYYLNYYLHTVIGKKI